MVLPVFAVLLLCLRGVGLPVQDPSAATVTYLADMKRALVTQGGFSDYTVRRAFIGGVVFPRALLADVSYSPSDPAAQSSYAVYNLNGQFETFAATVGRDDGKVTQGVGLVYFDVYADGRRIYHSRASKGAATDVTAPGAEARVTARPQEIRADVKGVRTLKLVAAYAGELTQTGSGSLYYGMGCVWGDARLLSSHAVRLDAQGAPQTALQPTAAALADPLFSLHPRASLALLLELDRKLKGRKRGPISVVIGPLKVIGSQHPEPAADARTDLLQALLNNNRLRARYRALDTARYDAILTKQGVADPPNAPAVFLARAARSMAAQVVVTGTISHRRDLILYSLRLLDAKDGQPRAAASVDAMRFTGDFTGDWN